MRKMSLLIVLPLHLAVVCSDSHSLRYYHTAVSAPGSGLPVYSSVGYVDDREIVMYSSDSRRYRPKVQWMEEKMEPKYWKEETENAKESEAISSLNMRILMRRFNQTRGLHVFQQMFGCDLRDDGSISGYDQYGYDGREFMFLDTETWTYIPTMAQAQISAQKWNSPEVQAGEIQKYYLENECIEWLKKYVEYGREDLERRVQPKVKVSGQERDGIVTLHCQVYGFHPKPVDVKWMKNGIDDVPSETTNVLPNPDGTYQIRVSMEVMPKEDESYSCYVDHSSLGEPLSTVWEPTKPSSWILPVIIPVVVIILLVGIGAGVFLYKKKSEIGYKKTKTSEKSSDSSPSDSSSNSSSDSLPYTNMKPTKV